MQANQGKRSGLNTKSGANTQKKTDIKSQRSDQASQKKQSYAEQVRSSRSSQSGSRGM